jgi:hypothetical protein
VLVGILPSCLTGCVGTESHAFAPRVGGRWDFVQYRAPGVDAPAAASTRRLVCQKNADSQVAAVPEGL